MQFAKEHGTSSFKVIDDGGIRVRPPFAQYFACAGSRNAFGPAEILDGDRHAMKRSAPLARGDLLVGSFGLLQRRIIQDGEVSAKSRVKLVDTIEDGTRSLDRSDFALME